MGYTNETTHYGIPLPTGSDLTTPMDYNEAMQDVDTALFAAKSDSDTALSKAEDLEVALGQTNDDLTALAGRVTTAEGTISDQGLALTSLGNKVDDNYTDVTDAICAYKEATATASRNYSVGDYFWYNDVLYRATTSIGSGTTIVPDTNCTTTNVTTELLGEDEIVLSESTADGTKSHGTLIAELFTGITLSNLTARTFIRYGTTVFALTVLAEDMVQFTNTNMSTTTGSVYLNGIAHTTTNINRRSQILIGNDGSVSFSDITSTAPAAGNKYELVVK